MAPCAKIPLNANRSLRICAGILLIAVAMPASTQTDGTEEWVLPRTEHGHPDLQGNWTNATLTGIQRPEGFDAVLTAEQIAAMEGRREQTIQADAAPSDPNREAPAKGGVYTGEALFDAATGGTGGYNYFYIDAGDRVAYYNGEPRSSLIVDPADGRIPAFTPEAEETRAAAAARKEGTGEFDNPESRPLGERCLLSFGNNLGPPMLPNYFYNNNYTIVQTENEVMIMTEMVYDIRVIRLGEHQPLPDYIRPWMGDSWGRWEGDTLVVETTNQPLKQVNAATYVTPGGSEQMKLTERFTRVGPQTINYEFTVDDPDFYTASWGGEVPFLKMNELIYEYACHEANYSLFNVLSGARAQESMGQLIHPPFRFSAIVFLFFGSFPPAACFSSFLKEKK